MVGPAPVWIEGPPREPRPFGLFSAAQVVEDDLPRWLMGGRYEVDYCGEAYDSAGVCWDFGTLSVAVDDTGVITIDAVGFPDGEYQILWGDEGVGEGPETPANLDGADHIYATEGDFAVTVTGPRSYGASVTATVTLGDFTDADATVGITKQPTTGITVVEGEAFAVLHMLECNPVGQDDLAERSRRGLQMGEQRAVERVVATSLARHPDTVILASGTALSVVDGLAVLEKYAGANYPGRATIHATPDVVTLLDAKGAVRQSMVNGSEVITTVQGTKVVSGGGYSPLRAPNPPDPDDGSTTPLAANDAGTEWLYITGVVQVRRAKTIEARTMVNVSGVSARNLESNLTERPYIVTWDCMVAAVLVSTEEAGPA